MNSTTIDLRDEVRHLAEEAFHLKLISGYGDSEYGDKYQIVCDGRPKHFSLERSRFILSHLITNSRTHEELPTDQLDSALEN
ncbi:MAG TPA: hypothetical protein V6C95_09355 [Coleofasciculaceae cyanobacterium]